jgi:hypothetical protein
MGYSAQQAVIVSTVGEFGFGGLFDADVEPGAVAGAQGGGSDAPL